ncbi:hypothetical protein ACLB2K_077503 [Fragaria x ananassa]
MFNLGVPIPSEAAEPPKGLALDWRKDDKGESNSLILWRKWVCCKERTRDKMYLEVDGLSCTPRKQTRVNCQARFQINYNDGSRVYMVKIFAPEHNHELATGNQIAFVRAHRHVSDAALALTNTMTRVSIRPCHTYEYMVEQARGYSVVGFTMKDLYNKLGQQRRTSPFERDSEGALSYMRALDEETYIWLLRTFLESMKGKIPKTVLTDSDEAMRKAIEIVMPEARHRLCIWHIGKNAFTHLKFEEKLKAFNRSVRKHQTAEQFERLWQEMIDEHDLHDDIWMGNMYEKRDKFCQAFFGDIFMAGMRSTQRCEGMNKEFKRVLGKGKSLVELVALAYILLMKLRHNQERDEFINMNSFPGAVTHLVDLEIQASSIFTHNVFKWIVSVYNRPEFDHTVVYHPEKETDSAEDPIMTDAGYNLLHKEISRLSSIVEGFVKEKEKVQAPATSSNMKGNVVRDPISVRTKGREKNDKKTEAPKRPITCGYCQGIGHNSQTCNVKKEKEKAEKKNENDE